MLWGSSTVRARVVCVCVCVRVRVCVSCESSHQLRKPAMNKQHNSTGPSGALTRSSLDISSKRVALLYLDINRQISLLLWLLLHAAYLPLAQVFIYVYVCVYAITTNIKTT